MLFGRYSIGISLGCMFVTCGIPVQRSPLTLHRTYAGFMDCLPGSNNTGYIISDSAKCVFTYVVDGSNPANTSCCMVSVLRPCWQTKASTCQHLPWATSVAAPGEGLHLRVVCRHNQQLWKLWLCDSLR